MTRANVFGIILLLARKTRKAGKHANTLLALCKPIRPGGKNMTKYEMLYILDAALSDEAKEAIVKKFEDLVKENGGAVEKSDVWGEKKLNYPINYKSEGYYVLLTFEAEKSFVVELERIAGITDGVIRRMITKR